MRSLEQLKRILAPPSKPVCNTVNSWAGVEAQLRTELPEDYKELVRVYGAGAIDEFMWILSPISRNEHLNIVHQRDVRLRAHEEFAAVERVPFEAFRGSTGLLPCASTDNGDVVYWNVRGSPRDEKWTIVLQNGRGAKWEEYSMSLAEFLLAVLTKSIVSRVFPDDFPSTPHVFLVSRDG